MQGVVVMQALAAVLIVFLLVAWRFVVLGTCTYLVFWQGHSGWWFLLAIVLCGGGSSE